MNEKTRIAIRELKRLLRRLYERGGAAVCSERMEGAMEARAAVREMIRQRIKELEISANEK
jgi:transcription initiation factor IIE alpha subunit